MGLDRLEDFRRAPKEPSLGREDFRLGEHAARHALHANSAQWSIEQYKVLAEDFEACVCNDLLANTRGGLPLAELAMQTGLSAGAARRAVRVLSSAGLVRSSGGRARSLTDDKFILPPPQLPTMAGVLGALRRHDARMAEEGKLVRNAPRTVRLTETNLMHFQRHIDQMMELGELYNNQENTADSAVYLVWAQIFKLFPRKTRARRWRGPGSRPAPSALGPS